LIEKYTEEGKRPVRADSSSAWPLRNIADALASRRSKAQHIFVSAVKDLNFMLANHIPVSKVFEVENSMPLQSPESHMTVLKGVFDSLKTLTKVDITFGSDQFEYDKTVCVEIVKSLSLATNLKHLELDNQHRWCYGCYHAFRRCLKHPWPLLEHLRISGKMSWGCVSHILDLNAQSLRILELVELEMSVGTYDPPVTRWDDLFEKIHSTLTLERADIRSLTDWPVVFFALGSGAKSEMNRMVENFLARRVEKLPRQEEWDFDRIPGASSDSDDSADTSLEDLVGYGDVT
jgi:hypothetical protein